MQSYLETSVKTYLAAVGASAIYVTIDHHTRQPINVGCAHTLDDRVLKPLRARTRKSAIFGWIAWAHDFSVLLSIAKTPDLMHERLGNGVKRWRTLAQIIEVIEFLATKYGIALTPHQRAVDRAAVLASYVDDALRELDMSGQFAAFNAAYKRHRLAAPRKIEPYWAVIERLRRLTIKTLVESPKDGLPLDRLLLEIRQQFPWFVPEQRRLKIGGT